MFFLEFYGYAPVLLKEDQKSLQRQCITEQGKLFGILAREDEEFQRNKKLSH
jgi:hypothetical protein